MIYHKISVVYWQLDFPELLGGCDIVKLLLWGVYVWYWLPWYTLVFFESFALPIWITEKWWVTNECGFTKHDRWTGGFTGMAVNTGGNSLKKTKESWSEYQKRKGHYFYWYLAIPAIMASQTTYHVLQPPLTFEISWAYITYILTVAPCIPSHIAAPSGNAWSLQSLPSASMKRHLASQDWGNPKIAGVYLFSKVHFWRISWGILSRSWTSNIV